MERLVREVSEDQILWRYMNLSKFLDMLINKHVVFARPDLFEDVYEANPFIHKEAVNRAFSAAGEHEIAKLAYEGIISSHKLSKYRTYISCWHMNNVESAGMWKLYCTNNESVAIKTNVRKLKDALIEPSSEFADTLLYEPVVYDLDLEELTKKYTELSVKKETISIHIKEVLRTKRPSFEHEKEYRVIALKKDKLMEPLDINKTEEELKKTTPLVQSVECDLNELVEEIIVAPDAPKWFVELVKKLIEDLGFDFKVTQSNLYTLA